MLALTLLLGLAGCRSAPVLQPFSTDGCSMFFDRAPLGTADWYSCCVAHGLAYWRGGTAEERLAADRELEHCVKSASDSPALAETMLAGVRAGGGPYFVTPYRWGYGWPYGRMYQSLTRQEDAEVATLRARHLATNPVLK
ncbi:hypothetical protein [Massilia sp. 9096]|uniref:hypothetical protein n=1 Tax=Massilia sp. 9096 TaxID=1500894 RepID=UPI00068984B2|nr:hypothetical protein [Massilia sp. 9096]